MLKRTGAGEKAADCSHSSLMQAVSGCDPGSEETRCEGFCCIDALFFGMSPRDRAPAINSGSSVQHRGGSRGTGTAHRVEMVRTRSPVFCLGLGPVQWTGRMEDPRSHTPLSLSRPWCSMDCSQNPGPSRAVSEAESPPAIGTKVTWRQTTRSSWGFPCARRAFL